MPRRPRALNVDVMVHAVEAAQAVGTTYQRLVYLSQRGKIPPLDRRDGKFGKFNFGEFLRAYCQYLETPPQDDNMAALLSLQLTDADIPDCPEIDENGVSHLSSIPALLTVMTD